MLYVNQSLPFNVRFDPIAMKYSRLNKAVRLSINSTSPLTPFRRV